MSPNVLPARPRLADHVLARRHLVGDEERVILHDLRSGQLLQLGPREWVLLSAADGTRDVEGIVIAAAREGAPARVPAAEAFFAQLHAAGLLGAEDAGEEASPSAPSGPAGPASPSPSPSPSPTTPALDPGAGDPRERPLEVLPDFSLHCDGRGSCCRIYASILFDPEEAARARALRPEVLGGGARHERAFTPERGTWPCAASVVSMRDGRCAYLEGEGSEARCSLHAIGGPEAKPLGCRTFPTSFIDDGESIRVSVAAECACVLASVGRPGGAPLIDPRLRARRDLDERIDVARLPDRAEVAPGATAGRAELVAWSRRLAAAAPPPDVAAGLSSLAAAVEAEGLTGGAIARFERPDPLAPAALAPWLAALHARAARRAREDAAWRSERDLAREATQWIAAATFALAEPDLLAALLLSPAPAPDRERFYLRAALHGHRLLGALPLSLALRDRAARLVVARALPLVCAEAGAADPACAEPIALVEAALRGHGLDAYAADVARAS
ncbi:YkgJ family cysteine cluster protein [Sorangium sp. So ce1182]|uniref:YkgJ family cysteine cluster protein n=1 Tax=Sorangium sp. So ce1182 TaxID=3133334 RepID=UPI003F63083C